MNWSELTSEQGLQELIDKSYTSPVVIYKHSTRCNISSMALNRLERSWDQSDLPDTEIFYLDLIRYREVSNMIETKFGVRHQSPQVLVIIEGKSSYDASHLGISYTDIKNVVQGATLVG